MDTSSTTTTTVHSTTTVQEAEEIMLHCTESSSALMPDQEEEESKVVDEVTGLLGTVKYEIKGVYWVSLPGHPSWPCRILSGEELMDKPTLEDGEVSTRFRLC